MKFIVILSLIIVIVLSSCKKDNNKTQEPACPVNTIYYKNNNPDTTINSSYYLDVNNDSTFDIRFQPSSWTEFCYTTQVYESSFDAFGLDSIEFIHKRNADQYPNCINPLTADTYIGFKDKTDTIIKLQFTDPCGDIWQYPFTKKSYIGFILHKNGKKYLGWICLSLKELSPFLVYEYATLSTQCDSIKIGQH